MRQRVLEVEALSLILARLMYELIPFSSGYAYLTDTLQGRPLFFFLSLHVQDLMILTHPQGEKPEGEAR